MVDGVQPAARLALRQAAIRFRSWRAPFFEGVTSAT
jgi:hypothetical protein